MCNEARRRLALGQLREKRGKTRVPLRFSEGLPNMAPLDGFRITDPTVILRAAAPPREPSSTAERDAPRAAELVTRRWSWPAANGRPVYNFRSEGRRIDNTATGGRCLIPVDGFYEFTDPEPGAKRKTKWLFTATPAFDSPPGWFCIAGLWRIDGQVGEAFAMLTQAPGPDIAPYHPRQVVLMPRALWADWIAGAAPAADLIRPLAAGSLHPERIARTNRTGSQRCASH